MLKDQTLHHRLEEYKSISAALYDVFRYFRCISPKEILMRTKPMVEDPNLCNYHSCIRILRLYALTESEPSNHFLSEIIEISQSFPMYNPHIQSKLITFFIQGFAKETEITEANSWIPLCSHLKLAWLTNSMTMKIMSLIRKSIRNSTEIQGLYVVLLEMQKIRYKGEQFEKAAEKAIKLLGESLEFLHEIQEVFKYCELKTPNVKKILALQGQKKFEFVRNKPVRISSDEAEYQMLTGVEAKSLMDEIEFMQNHLDSTLLIYERKQMKEVGGRFCVVVKTSPYVRTLTEELEIRAQSKNFFSAEEYLKVIKDLESVNEFLEKQNIDKNTVDTDCFVLTQDGEIKLFRVNLFGSEETNSSNTKINGKIMYLLGDIAQNPYTQFELKVYS